MCIFMRKKGKHPHQPKSSILQVYNMAADALALYTTMTSATMEHPSSIYVSGYVSGRKEEEWFATQSSTNKQYVHWYLIILWRNRISVSLKLRCSKTLKYLSGIRRQNMSLWEKILYKSIITCIDDPLSKMIFRDQCKAVVSPVH